MPAGEFERRYFCFLKSGMESWIPEAVKLAPKMKQGTKAKDVLDMFVGLWMKTHQSDDQDLYDQMQSMAGGMGNVKVVKLPRDDPYWKTVGIGPEGDQS